MSERFVGDAACVLLGRNDARYTGCTGFVALAQRGVIGRDPVMGSPNTRLGNWFWTGGLLVGQE